MENYFLESALDKMNRDTHRTHVENLYLKEMIESDRFGTLMDEDTLTLDFLSNTTAAEGLFD